MKRALLIVVCILLVFAAACSRIGAAVADAVKDALPAADDVEEKPVSPEKPAADDGSKPAETPPEEKPPVPDISEPAADPPAPDKQSGDGLPLDFDRYLAYGFETEGVMFTYDIDGDGNEEDIAFYEDEDNYSCVFDVGGVKTSVPCTWFDSAVLADLDPETPHINLIVSADIGSSDYLTWEMHLEDGALVVSDEIGGRCALDDGRIIISEHTDIFGTYSGSREYFNEPLVPKTEWVNFDYIPTEEELEEDRESLIEYGILLHTVRDIPCIFGDDEAEEGVIPAGSYIYRLQYTDPADRVTVSLEDGRFAVIFIEYDPEDYNYKINGVEQDEYFDNIAYAG